MGNTKEEAMTRWLGVMLIALLAGCATPPRANRNFSSCRVSLNGSAWRYFDCTPAEVYAHQYEMMARDERLRNVPREVCEAIATIYGVMPSFFRR